MIRMTPKEFLETGLLEQYVMDLLDPQEAKQVASYIEKHPSLVKTYNEMQETILNLAESHGIQPPAEMKAKVMQGIEPQKAISETTASSSWIKYLPSIAAVLFGAISLISYNKINTLERKIQSEKIAYTTLSEDCENAKKEYENQNRIYAFYKDANTESVILSGNAKAPDFELVSRYNKNTSSLILDVTQSAKISDDKVLCLWGDKDGKMILIAKLDPSALGSMIPFDSKMESFNVTIEERKASIDHPDVSQLIASAAI